MKRKIIFLLAFIIMVMSTTACGNVDATNRISNDGGNSIVHSEDTKKDIPRSETFAMNTRYESVEQAKTGINQYLRSNSINCNKTELNGDVLVVDITANGDGADRIINQTKTKVFAEKAALINNSSDYCSAVRVNLLVDGESRCIYEQASCKDKLAPYINSCKDKSVADVEQGLEKLNTESFKYKDREDYVLNNSQVKLDTIDTYSLTLEFECTTEEAAKQADDFALGLHSAIAFNNTDFAYTTIVVKYKGEYINYTIMNNMNESMSGYNAPVCTSDVSAS